MATEKLKVHAAEPEEEEDLVDPMENIRSECVDKHCANFKEKLQECTDRVTSRKNTAETCEEELFDLLHCRDHCAYKEIFKNVK